jgi:hypothetical protein
MFVACIGIAFPPKVDEKRTKRVKKNENGEEIKKEVLQPLMGAFGKVDKEEAVQKLSWVTYEEQKLVTIYLTKLCNPMLNFL